MSYNGWANYQTWNVALWIQNDYPLYELAQLNKGCTYEELTYVFADAVGPVTPDMVAWSDSRLDHKALNEMLEELAQ
jgi:hypothetical protein